MLKMSMIQSKTFLIPRNRKIWAWRRKDSQQTRYQGDTDAGIAVQGLKDSYNKMLQSAVTNAVEATATNFCEEIEGIKKNKIKF